MNFLNPWWAALAALSIPLIIAFLNRRRVLRRTVPSHLLLRQLQSDRPSRRHFSVPQQWLALLLCLLALVAVVLASTDPVLEGEEPQTTVLVIDTSASMAAVEPGERGSRLDRGLEKVQETLSGISGRDRVAVVELGADTHLALRPTQDREALATALGRLDARGVPSQRDAAFTMAEGICTASPRGRILLVTDGANLTVPPLACPVELVQVGDEASNVAITAFTAREVDGLGDVEVWLEVTNASAEDRTLNVDLLADDALAEVIPLSAAAGARVGRLIRLERVHGQHLEARLAGVDGDALQQDDRAHAWLDRGAQTRVLLVTDKPTGFTSEAFGLHPKARLTVVAPDALDPRSGPWDLLVLEAPTADAALPRAAHVMALGRAAVAAGATEVERPRVVWWSFDHALFRYVDLDRIEIEAAYDLGAEEGDVTLVRGDKTGSLVTLRQRDGRPWLLFGFVPERSDLVLRVAFANLVANVVDWAVGPGGASTVAMQPGQRVPNAAPGTTLQRIGAGVVTNAPASTPVMEPGVYTLRGPDGAERATVVVNALSGAEATLSPVTELPNTVPATATTASWTADLWRLPVLLALLLLGIEWLLPALRRRRATPKAATTVEPTPVRPPARLRR